MNSFFLPPLCPTQLFTALAVSPAIVRLLHQPIKAKSTSSTFKLLTTTKLYAFFCPYPR